VQPPAQPAWQQKLLYKLVTTVLSQTDTMEDFYYQITLPNTCALTLGPNMSYEEADPAAKVWPPASQTGFEEFLTAQDAATRAVEIDPTFNGNLILGPLDLQPVDVSSAETDAFVGQSVVINSEYECTDLTATVTYSWSGPTGDLGITTSSLSFDNLSEDYSGTYICTVSASNPVNQTGEVVNFFTLTVTPAPNPSGVINTGRSGASVNDLAPSYFPTLNNLPAGATEADLELYVPGTDTVISYNPELPEPFKFDSLGNCFNTGDYRLVIRVAATSQVLATVYPPAGANQNILWLYNPVVPS